MLPASIQTFVKAQCVDCLQLVPQRLLHVKLDAILSVLLLWIAITAAESPGEKDLLWTGSDDGLINVSKDGGNTWTNVTPKDAPKWIMWNRLEVDPIRQLTANVAGTRYKLDDF